MQIYIISETKQRVACVNDGRLLVENVADSPFLQFISSAFGQEIMKEVFKDFGRKFGIDPTRMSEMT